MLKSIKKEMSKLVAIILTAAVFFNINLLPVTTAKAESANYPGVFTVTVKDEAGNYIKDATVKAYNTSFSYFDASETLVEDSFEFTVNTDDTGVAAFPDITQLYDDYNASFTVYYSVTKDGFTTVENSVDVTDATIAISNISVEMKSSIIEDVTIEGMSLTYNGKAQTIVSVTSQDGDVVKYEVNGAAAVTDIPKATDAGTYEIKVTVSRPGKTDFVKTVSTTISPAEIKNIDITAVLGLGYNEKPQKLVSLTGSFLETDIVTWTVNENMFTSHDLPEGTAIGKYNINVTVDRGPNYVKFVKAVSVEIGLGELNLGSLAVSANNRIYNAIAENALIVKNQGSYDLEYRLGTDGEWVKSTIPQIKDAGSYDIYVKATKEGYNEKTLPVFPITVTIKKADIVGVTANGYQGTYDRNSHNAVLSVNGTISGDSITYSNRENGPFSETIPAVKHVKDSGSYYVKISRNDNFNELIIKVNVSISKNASQTISFAETPDITYNDNNTFSYLITSKSADDSAGNITYSRVGGSASARVSSDGTVTYTSAGTVKVKAVISECENYTSASATYEISINHIAAPALNITDAVAVIGDCSWYNSDVIIYADNWKIIKGSNAPGQSGWSDKLTESAEKKYAGYKVALMNTNGDITDLISINSFAIDKTAPTEKNNVNVVLKDKNTDTLSKIINFLTFGLFCNEAVEITVNCDDESLTAGAPFSGVASIQLFKYGKNGSVTEVAPDSDKANVFTIDTGFEGTLKVKITDKVGNTLGEQLVSSENSNMKSSDGYIMLEAGAPAVSELVDTPVDENVRVEAGTHRYSGDANVEFSVQDTESGIYSVEVTLNGNPYDVSPSSFDKQDREKHTYTLSTVGKNPDEDGKYEFSVTVTDNAGNVTQKALTLEKDLTSPVITDFEFKVNSETVGLDDVVSIDDYGYYFNQTVSVKVVASDLKVSGELNSGVDLITVVLVDNNGKYYTVNSDMSVIPIASVSDAICHTVTDNSLVFNIVENFKGQIYAYATDKVGNMPLNSKFDFTPVDVVSEDGNVLRGYIHPNGSVLESAELHKNTSSIVITAPAKSGLQNNLSSYKYNGTAQKDKSMSYNDSQNVPLYNSNPVFTLKIEDLYSGIKSVKTTVIVNGIETVKILNISNLAEMSGDEIGEWTIEKDTDSNLVYGAERKIEIDANLNDIVLLVELTDRAGNISYDYYVFGVDKSAPVVTVVMNDDDNSVYSGFFDKNRVAEFEIKELNFSNKNVVFSVTVTDENNKTVNVTVTPDFKPETDGNGSKLYTAADGSVYFVYKMSYIFDKDGDYTFDVKLKDLADNDNSDVSYVNTTGENIKDICVSFTVDKTAPVVNVVYDNNDASNGNYFNADRIATITVKEHNFTADDVEIIGSATDSSDGTAVTTTFPAISDWKDNGNNTYTATVSYTADSRYSFDINYKDKAGNAITDYTADVFYIDKTAPAIEITGVADKSANKGDVAPVISYSDTNFNKDSVTIALNGVKNGDVDYSAAFSDITNGQKYTFENFEVIKNVDDIYTLTVKLTDMAGNSTEKTISFSVNRFGSSYDLSEVKDILGKYLMSERDIIFTETNVDSLDRESTRLVLTKNGTPSDLTEGKDYTVEVSGGNGKWSIYKYTVNKSLFTADGRYSISIYSEDAAGNINENIDEAKSAEISFGIDKTVPVIVPIDLESDTQYPETVKHVSVEIKDNLVLANVKILLNDKEIDYSVDGETYSFDIPESSSLQSVKIIATDSAGNEVPLFIDDILVSTNFFVRWYNNTPLFVGSIIGFVVIIIAIAALLIFRKRKK